MKKSYLQVVYNVLFFVTFNFIVCSVIAQKPDEGLIANKTALAHSDLETNFKNPPHLAKLQAMWFWQGANFSKEGITKDLEAMKASGLGAALIFNINNSVGNVPWRDNTYRGEKYWDALLHAAREADRLGMTIGISNSPGYCGTGGPWMKEEMNMRRLVWLDTTIEGGNKLDIHFSIPRLSASAGKMNTSTVSTYYNDIAVLAAPLSGTPIPVGNVLNLTKYLQSDGTLKWDAPAGQWKVYRIGYAPTMAESHPLPDDVQGKSFEADKFNPQVTAYHWKNVLQPIQQHLGKYYGKSFNVLHIDSYESGIQNWSQNFAAEFIKRKGYDPTPWLVTMGTPILGWKSGQYNGGIMSGLPASKDRIILNSPELTKRFEWDFGDMVEHLFGENIKMGINAVHADGLKFSYEPYAGPFNTIEGAAMPDFPMATFWTSVGSFQSKSTEIDGNGNTSPIVSGGARAAGNNIVACESYTGMPLRSRFNEAPYQLKYLADGAFLCGVNQMVLHQWVHQPFDDKYQPGMCNNYWGTHFSRYQTWLKPGKAFFDYIIHSQAMLQFGKQVIDRLTIDAGDDQMSDYISSYDFIHDKTKVDKGMVVLSSGRRYYYVIYPGKNEILPELAEKLNQLAQQGAVMVISKPLTKSSSLKGYPQCDKDIAELYNRISKYKNVVSSKEEAIKYLSLADDYSVLNAQEPDKIGVVHRTDDKEHVYFVVNRSSNAQNVTLKFRISGMQPELWDADKLTIANAAVWSQQDNNTQVSLALHGLESVFVVFRHKAGADNHIVSVEPSTQKVNWWMVNNNIFLSEQGNAKVIYNGGKEKTLLVNSHTKSETIAGGWDVSFTPKFGDTFNKHFEGLQDWSKNENDNIRYFSGTAVYKRNIQMDSQDFSPEKRIELSLGEMHDIARVRINNGKYLCLWYKPFKTDVTDFLKPGLNEIEIEVTNTWANALIGDEKIPADFVTKPVTGKGYFVKDLPDWFVKNQKRPSTRKTFSIFNYYDEKSEPQPAGLMGPVTFSVFQTTK